jgi:hypothetical protein
MECVSRLNPELSFLVEEEFYEREDKTVVGYAMAVINAKDINSRTDAQVSHSKFVFYD